MSMKNIVIATALVASIFASVLSVSANDYIDPRAPFDGYKFFESLPTGQ